MSVFFFYESNTVRSRLVADSQSAVSLRKTEFDSDTAYQFFDWNDNEAEVEHNLPLYFQSGAQVLSFFDFYYIETFHWLIDDDD